MTRRRNGGHGPGLGELLKIWGSPSIFTQWLWLAALKFGAPLGFAKAHHKIIPIEKSGHSLGLGELPKIFWFHFNIYTMAEARDFKFRTQLGFTKAQHKTTPR